MQLHPSITTAEATARTAESEAIASRSGSRLRRRLLWTGAVTALLLLLIFIPPLVNANRYQRQIVRSMSESLGRPVHLDNVTLHLLPVPGLTLSNLVVSEEPAFGAEPTIRANTVEATLRLGSLWRRRVEFSTVRFIEPSVNLVRDAQGRWNLADILLHASHVDTAPTVQRRAGPTPRFPYIEATGGRVNIKFGEEKLPFSLTDADFALWLPTANQWRVRLEGQPARTDTNISDPGTLRFQGDLRRADTAAGIPVDFHVSWHDAPLGEASRLVTGNDLGWRGTLNLDASLTGTLLAGQLRTQLTLGGLRRAEFAPAQPLDLQIACGAALATTAGSLHQLRCTLPDSAPEPLALEASAVDLSELSQAGASVTAEAIPLHWGLLWAALFSSRVATDLHPAGSMDLTLQHVPAGAQAATAAQTMVRGRRRRSLPQLASTGTATPSGNWDGWNGTVHVHLPPAPALGTAAPTAKDGNAPGPTELVWRMAPAPVVAKLPGEASVAGEGIAFLLQPVSIALGGTSALNLTAAVTSSEYTVSVAGTASAAALLLPARYLPQLGDGLEAVLPSAPTGLGAARVDFSCAHPWGGLQTCTALRPSITSGRDALPVSRAPTSRPRTRSRQSGTRQPGSAPDDRPGP